MNRVPASFRPEFDERLGTLGYEYAHGVYSRPVADGVATIEVTADKWSARAPIARLTANLGFYSRVLGSVFGPPSFVGGALDEVHWFRGIGAIRESDPADQPGRGIWTVQREDRASLERAVGEMVVEATTSVDRYAANSSIRDLWLEEGDFFWEAPKQDAFLAVLLAVLGPADALPAVVGRLDHFASEGSRIAQRAREAVAALKPGA